MRPYEVMIILEAAADDATVDMIVERAFNVVTEAGGTTGQVDKWGRRRFAYELKHRWEGYYVVAEFSVEPSAIKEIDRQLGLADEVIRHKVVKLPENVAGRQKPASSEAEAPEADAATTGA